MRTLSCHNRYKLMYVLCDISCDSVCAPECMCAYVCVCANVCPYTTIYRCRNVVLQTISYLCNEIAHVGNVNYILVLGTEKCACECIWCNRSSMVVPICMFNSKSNIGVFSSNKVLNSKFQNTSSIPIFIYYFKKVIQYILQTKTLTNCCS